MAVNRPFDIAASRAYLQAREQTQFEERERRRGAALQAVSGAIHAVAPQFPDLQRVYLFGSVVRSGCFGAMSDVDVAVEPALKAEDYFSLWRELERAAPGWEIDLVELDNTLHFADRVRQVGELIYERSSTDPQT